MSDTPPAPEGFGITNSWSVTFSGLAIPVSRDQVKNVDGTTSVEDAGQKQRLVVIHFASDPDMGITYQGTLSPGMSVEILAALTASIAASVNQIAGA